MAKNYSDLLVEFKDKINKVDDNRLDYGFLQACCVDFFNDIEELSTKHNKKSLEYLKFFDFNSLYVIDSRFDLKIMEKNFLTLGNILTLAIDKYGVDLLVKELLPESIESVQSNLFFSVINWFFSLFRETEISIKQDYELNEALSEAVCNLRDLRDRKKGLPYLNRGTDFTFSLNELCLTVFKKYANPLKNTSIYPVKELKTVVGNKVVAAYQLRTGINWWESYSVKDDEWDNEEDEQANENRSVLQAEPIYANIPFVGSVDPEETAFPFPGQVVTTLPASTSPPPLPLSSPPILASAPPPPPLPLSPLAEAMAKADEDQARSSVQTVEKGSKGLPNDELKRVCGGGATKFEFKYHVTPSEIEKEPIETNNNNFFIRSMEARRRVVKLLSDSSISEDSYQSDSSDNDEEARIIQRKKRKMSVEKCERGTTVSPALIASGAMNDRLISPLANEIASVNGTIVLSESSTLVPDTNSVLSSRPAVKPRPKLLLNNQSGKLSELSEGERLTTADLVVQSYSGHKGIKQPFPIAQGDVALLAQSLERNVFARVLPDDVNVSKQPLSPGMVIKVN